MFRWFREKRRQQKFNWAFAQAAQVHFDEGELSWDRLQTCLSGAKNNKIMKEARSQLMTAPGMLGGFRDWDWEGIRKWFIEVFIPALKIILPMILAII